jgi:hypothetical protein
MLIVDSLIISGVKFVLTRLAEAVEAEMYDETHLREELLAAQMRLELGEITEDEFASIEEQVLAGLREIGERKRGITREEKSDAPRTFSIESVSADFSHRDEPED